MRLVLAVGLATVPGLTAAFEAQVADRAEIEARSQVLVRSVISVVSKRDSDLKDYSYFDRLPPRLIESRGLPGTVSVIWCSAHAIYGADGRLRAFHLGTGDTATSDRRLRARKTVGPAEARVLLNEYRTLFGEVGPIHVLATSRAVENGLDVFMLL